MLPVCSAMPSCTSSSLISFHLGTRTVSSVQKPFVEYKGVFRNSDSVHHCESFFKTHAARVLHLPDVESVDQAGSTDSSIFSRYSDEFHDIVSGLSNNLYGEPNKWGSSMQEINGSYPVGNDVSNLVSSTVSKQHIFVGDITVELSTENNAEIPLITNIDLQDSLDQTSNVVASQASSGSESVSTSIKSLVSENAASLPDAFETANKGISDLKSSFENVFSNIQESLDTTYNSFTSSINDNVKSVTQSVDNGVSSLIYSAENAKQQAGGKLAVFSGDFKDNIYRAGTVAVDILRQAIISLEDSLASATAFVVYSYGSTKVLLPEEARNVLNNSEEKATEILKPVASAFQQVLVVVEMLERSLGLDPNDPIVPFIIFLGTSATLGVSYWVLRYSGYSGDLSPELTLELLKNKESAVLIDVRPEDLREKEGIPDLRRGARFKYTSVTFPKVDSSAKKLLKNVSNVDDDLLAVVIRNFKRVQTGSKVIIMDACGERSKGIARSLRKFGVKRPYLVQGGFRSWVKNGLQIKQLKADTALTILNEEAEAILDDIRPTPTLVVGYGLAFSAAIYGLLEWEKTLQLIGLVGLGQTLYKRLASYEDSEDFKQDLRLLLAPVTLGAEAFSWAAGKLDPTKIGLPMSPSSTAVQDRVLQAVAKHESQASDAQSSAPIAQPSEPIDQAGDLSEA